MEAATLNCPNCGGAVSSDATQCQYCRARLATVACPSCFGLAFIGSKFCPHCGAALAEKADDGTSVLACPNCDVQMSQKTINDLYVTECPKCSGLWLDAATFEKICADREEQSAVLGNLLGPDPLVSVDPNPRYRPCPRCGQLMNRLNFARASGVIIDICKPHGVWFDRDELRRIIEFIRAGGIDRAREKQKEQLDEARRALESAQISRTSGDIGANYSASYTNSDLVAAFGLAGSLLRRVIK